jgi:hypothetical protein
MPDPKLKAVAAEIAAILKKHDVAGTVVLSSPNFMEYLHHFEASWNALHFETVDGKPALRFRCKRADYPTKEAWAETMRVTIGTVQGFADALLEQGNTLQGLALTVGRKVHYEHMTKNEGD